MDLGILSEEIKVVNIGNPEFAADLRANNVPVTDIDWQPPARGDSALFAALERVLSDPRVEDANRIAYERYDSSNPVLVGVDQARHVIPGMHENMILHSGPPITWDRMAGAVKGAVIGALIFEGRASCEEEAVQLVEQGTIELSPCHEHSAVGPMAGIISPSMPVYIVENKTYGNRAYCTMNEGPGKALRFGAYGESVIKRLCWMRDILGPSLAKAVAHSGGIELRPMMAEAMHMGDEMHNRNKAATSLFIRAITPHLAQSNLSSKDLSDIIQFMAGVDHSFLNLSMPASKCMLDAANGVPYSTLVTCMARNGTVFGIQISGLGKRWFTGPAQMIKGIFLPGFSEKDACPDVGDSAIAETGGFGGFAMAAAFAIVQVVGGKAADAIRISKQMYEITMEENSFFTIPVFDFRGTPTGIDLRKVISTGILPTINTGMAHKDAGIGQVGAGLVNPPWECFRDAMFAFAQEIS